MWAVVRNEDIIHHTSNIIHLLLHHPSSIKHHTSYLLIAQVVAKVMQFDTASQN